MTDKELLELAAKAIGMKLEYNYLGGRSSHQPWDPLTDDGDALRMAVELEMEMGINGNHAHAKALFGPHSCATSFKVGDPVAAMRRAIVCAAAEIGKAMP